MKSSALIHAAALVASALLPAVLATPNCRSLPVDNSWPNVSQWDALNKTVGGRLVATHPLGSPCHAPTYNAVDCAALQGGWLHPQMHITSSSSVMAPFYANQSCDPWTAASKPCTLGNYVSYAVNATSADDIIAAVKFTQAKNIRLVIRNTGHDYSGKSTGAGALGVWTYYLKTAEVQDWNDSFYKGKSIKLGAGVQGFEAMAAAKASGLVVVGGECPTVGITGGYTQGGGHSALSTSFGLAADQTLSFEVVTADGRLVTASRIQNCDLYWALSGGGGGTYGVVVSMTAKAHLDTTVSGASIIFMAAHTTPDKFYAAIEAFHEELPGMVDSGAMVVYYFSNAFFQIAPLTAYNQTSAQVKQTLSAFMATLDDLNVPYTSSFSESATYTEHYDTYFGPLPFGNINIGIAQQGGRLIPRSTITANNAGFMAMARNITENGVLFIGVGTDVSAPAAHVSNAVLPAWRSALVHATLTTDWDFHAPWAEMVAQQTKMTREIMPQIEAVTPGSGAYMNEADANQPNYREVFFGDNYAQLEAIKDKWDPEHLFYATKSVGSERWS